MFRHFAARYHPDNKETGNRALFDLVIKAHDVLGHPEKRAAYDVQYKAHSDLRWKIGEEAANGKGVDRDADVQNRMLAIFYAKRRRNLGEPGSARSNLSACSTVRPSICSFTSGISKRNAGSRQPSGAPSRSQLTGSIVCKPNITLSPRRNC